MKKTGPELFSRKIFKEAALKKMTKKFAISKFLTRIFLKYRDDFSEGNPFPEYISSLCSEFEGKRENKFNLEKDIGKIFGRIRH